MRQEIIVNMNAVDASEDQVGDYFLSEWLVAASAQVIGTGTSAGTVKFQYSNDSGVQLGNENFEPVNWSDVPSATVNVTAAGVFAIPKFDVCYGFMRTVYTHTPGATGTITVNVKTLGF